MSAYTSPTIPIGKGDVVAMINGGVTVSAKALVDDTVAASVTRTVKFDVPRRVGVPVTTPPAESDNPAGSVPEETVQVYGMVPPVAVSVCVYAALSTAAVKGDADVITSGAGPIVSANTFVTVAVSASVTRTVNVDDVTDAGVPEITPPDDRFNPAGSVPDARDHVYGVVPPAAASVVAYGEFICPAVRGDVLVMLNGPLIESEIAFDAVKSFASFA